MTSVELARAALNNGDCAMEDDAVFTFDLDDEGEAWLNAEPMPYCRDLTPARREDYHPRPSDVNGGNSRHGETSSILEELEP